MSGKTIFATARLTTGGFSRKLGPRLHVVSVRASRIKRPSLSSRPSHSARCCRSRSQSSVSCSRRGFSRGWGAPAAIATATGRGDVILRCNRFSQLSAISCQLSRRRAPAVPALLSPCSSCRSGLRFHLVDRNSSALALVSAVIFGCTQTPRDHFRSVFFVACADQAEIRGKR